VRYSSGVNVRRGGLCRERREVAPSLDERDRIGTISARKRSRLRGGSVTVAMT